MLSQEQIKDALAETLLQAFRSADRGLRKESFSIEWSPTDEADNSYLERVAEVRSKQRELANQYAGQNIGDTVGDVFSNNEKVVIHIKAPSLRNISSSLPSALKASLGNAHIRLDDDIKEDTLTFYGSAQDMANRMDVDAFATALKRLASPGRGFGLTGID